MCIRDRGYPVHSILRVYTPSGSRRPLSLVRHLVEKVKAGESVLSLTWLFGFHIKVENGRLEPEGHCLSATDVNFSAITPIIVTTPQLVYGNVLVPLLLLLSVASLAVAITLPTTGPAQFTSRSSSRVANRTIIYSIVLYFGSAYYICLLYTSRCV